MNTATKATVWLILSMCMIGIPFSFLAYGSDLRTRQSVLYPFPTSIQEQTDFLGSSVASPMAVFNGTTSNPGPEANRPGILRRETTAVINTVAGTSLGNGAASVLPSDTHTVLWIARLNTNDANTTVRIGEFESPASSPPTNGIYFEKLDADTNWFCITRAAGVQTRTDSTIAVTTSFEEFTLTRNSSGVLFKIGTTNVCGTTTTNIPTAGVRPATQIVNSAAANKTLDHDYFEINMTLQR